MLQGLCAPHMVNKKRKELLPRIRCEQLVSIDLTLLSDKEHVKNLPSLLSFATGFAAAIRALNIGYFRFLGGRTSYLFYISLVAGVISDWIIAGQLLVFLRRSGCIAKKICSTASLITCAIWPQEFIYVIFYFGTTKLHLSSLFATLDSEPEFCDRFDGVASSPRNTPLPEHIAIEPDLTRNNGESPFDETDLGTLTLNESERERHHALPVWYQYHKWSFATTQNEESNAEKFSRTGKLGLRDLLPTTAVKLQWPIAFKSKET
ncbi:hypothetical protein H0H81_008215 [Sphagnurus paluster]|uniref:Uncharacterized protein n=1 Tax=Sphagnurus paluster TaxID=117069 RepID=A0A9P7GR91_9AGAR|nr:hypothetical protein H0H81_008215 [Sphagnurus paluster]